MTGPSMTGPSMTGPSMTGRGGGDPPKGIRTMPAPTETATRMFLIRHGEAVCNVAGVVGGPKGCTGLTPRGVIQVGKLRDRLLATGETAEATALYASILPRATQTAALIAPAVGDGKTGVVTDCGLCELHPGLADGLTWDGYTALYQDPDWDLEPEKVVAPGGESWTGFTERASSVLVALADRHPGEVVVVSCHAGIIEASMIAFLTTGERHRLGLRTEHTSITEWERSNGQWRLARYNDSSHLVV
jgi:probable phosphoglycerate mutase